MVLGAVLASHTAYKQKTKRGGLLTLRASRRSQLEDQHLEANSEMRENREALGKTQRGNDANESHVRSSVSHVKHITNVYFVVNSRNLCKLNCGLKRFESDIVKT